MWQTPALLPRPWARSPKAPAPAPPGGSKPRSRCSITERGPHLPINGAATPILLRFSVPPVPVGSHVLTRQTRHDALKVVNSTDQPTSTLCPRPASNRQPPPFQSSALPPELHGQWDRPPGLEPGSPSYRRALPVELRTVTDSRPTRWIRVGARRARPGVGAAGCSHTCCARHETPRLGWLPRCCACTPGEIRTRDPRIKSPLL